MRQQQYDSLHDDDLRLLIQLDVEAAQEEDPLGDDTYPEMEVENVKDEEKKDVSDEVKDEEKTEDDVKGEERQRMM